MRADVAGEETAVTIVIHACAEGGFTAECLEIPGCFSEGETEQEAEQNIRAAVDACLSVLFEDCITRQRAKMDLSEVNLRDISKQEKLSISTPHLQLPTFA